MNPTTPSHKLASEPATTSAHEVNVDVYIVYEIKDDFFAEAAAPIRLIIERFGWARATRPWG